MAHLKNISHVKNIGDLLYAYCFEVDFVAPVRGDCVIISFAIVVTLHGFLNGEWKFM